jgi:hypothetical protein
VRMIIVRPSFTKRVYTDLNPIFAPPCSIILCPLYSSIPHLSRG